MKRKSKKQGATLIVLGRKLDKGGKFANVKKQSHRVFVDLVFRRIATKAERAFRFGKNAIHPRCQAGYQLATPNGAADKLPNILLGVTPLHISPLAECRTKLSDALIPRSLAVIGIDAEIKG